MSDSRVRAAALRSFALLIGALLLSFVGCTRQAPKEPVAAVEPSASNAASEECRLGVQLYSFRNELDRDLPGTLARVKELGLDCIEPYSLHGRTPEALRAEFDRAGLQVISFHLPRELFVGSPQAAVDVASALGARQLGVAWIKESEKDVVDEAKLMAAAERLNAMCQPAQAAGMDVFYHTHGYEFHEGDTEGRLFDRFVNALQPGCVVLQLDAYWVAYAGQDPVELLRRYSDRTLSLHLKDMAASFEGAPFDGSQWTGPLSDEAFAVIGEGKLDWETLLQVADEAAVQWYIIEDETTRPIENIAAAMPFLRSHGL